MESQFDARKRQQRSSSTMTTRVKLNVGGQLFETNWETLEKAPADSKLSAMFMENTLQQSEDESYFIDRDGTHFRYILNYLRTGELIVPENRIVRKELLAEVEFYQVEGMIDKLRARPFKDSVILSSDQRQTLINWLKDTLTGASHDYVLLYRASRDGWAASHFHSCCDNKGPTVTVVKSGSYIFGGYTGKPWEGSGGWKRAPNSFLFSLVNPSGLPPTKLPLMAGEERFAIYCNSSYGPIFGLGHDLCIDNAHNSANSSYACLNHTYQCPPGQTTDTFLAGNQKFTVNELEVFGFEK